MSRPHKKFRKEVRITSTKNIVLYTEDGQKYSFAIQHTFDFMKILRVLMRDFLSKGVYKDISLSWDFVSKLLLKERAGIIYCHKMAIIEAFISSCYIIEDLTSPSTMLNKQVFKAMFENVTIDNDKISFSLNDDAYELLVAFFERISYPTILSLMYAVSGFACQLYLYLLPLKNTGAQIIERHTFIDMGGYNIDGYSDAEIRQRLKTNIESINRCMDIHIECNPIREEKAIMYYEVEVSDNSNFVV